jgi:pseudouridine-5'-phosphate glycosidase
VHPLIDMTDEVAAALAANSAVVALESTIISHGMPYPDNVSTAQRVEQTVREMGAVPATVAVIEGRLRVGLDDLQLDRLANPAVHGSVQKASRRDLAAIVAFRATAGTTVAATMHIAHLAGIEVFATGGIGGVHRGAEESFDISADLIELGRTPVTVVCAGAKSILDLPKTLEVLETQGVPVIGYRTDEFPSFFSASSGQPLTWRADSTAELAALVRAQRSLMLDGGMLVAQPLPVADAVPGVGGIIERAITDADDAGITGKDVTPYLLSRINQLTGGRSLKANIALILANARLAAELAVALAAPDPASATSA